MTVFDHAVVFTLNHLVSQIGDVTNVALALWFFADFLPYLGLGLALFVVLREPSLAWSKRRTAEFFGNRIFAAAFILGSAVFSRLIFTEIARFFWDRSRPFEVLDITAFLSHNGGHSFPSGHASFFFAAAAAVWMLNRKMGWWFFGVSILMGLARVAGGIHWPSDIVAGAIIGIFSAFIFWRIVEHLRANSTLKTTNIDTKNH